MKKTKGIRISDRTNHLLTEYISKVNNSTNGLPIQWEEFIELSSKFHQIFEIILLESHDLRPLKYYEKNKIYMHPAIL